MRPSREEASPRRVRCRVLTVALAGLLVAVGGTLVADVPVWVDLQHVDAAGLLPLVNSQARVVDWNRRATEALESKPIATGCNRSVWIDVHSLDNTAGFFLQGIAQSAVCPQILPGVRAGTLSSPCISEASGLVASRQHDDILWTHNDNSYDTRIFAVRSDGALVATYTIGEGTATLDDAYDCEDIAIGPGPTPGVDYIFWGDIGDNENVRPRSSPYVPPIFVRRFPEPTGVLGNATVPDSQIDRIVLAFPAGADAPTHKDAETLLVDPVNGDIYVITKRTEVGRVYRAPFPQSTTQTVTLEFVAELPWGVAGGTGGATGGDVSPDGSRVIVRRYTWYDPQATHWHRPAGSPLWEAFNGPACSVPLILEEKGEAVCFQADGRGYYTVSEGLNQAINHFSMASCASASDCDDGNACTDSVCADGVCELANNTAPCDDGLFCTGTDACLNGNCVGWGDPCPGQICDEANDACVPCGDNADCDDGNPCTDDHCVAGACVCANNTVSCEDGLDCTHPDACADGACVGSDQCPTGWVCSPLSGECVAQTATLTFQNGHEGYADTHDTFLQQGLPNQSHGGLDTWEWDGQDGSVGGGKTIGLLRFDGIFGAGPGLIPPGSVITSAQLVLVVTDPGSGTAGRIDECAVAWDQSSATWNNFGGEAGVQADELGDYVAPAPMGGGTATIDVTSSVQAWSNNPAASFGWVFSPNHTDGVQVRSAEQTILVSGRPKLIVVLSGAIPCNFDEDCDDDNPCTDDSCVRQACVRFALPDNASCADDKWCDGQETCQGGICTDGAGPCEDLAHCNEVHDTCVQCVLDGECSNDTNSCTYDGCTANVCNGPKPDDTPCPDGVFCNGEEVCRDGVCMTGTTPCQDPCEQCDEYADTCEWCIYDIHPTGFIGPGDFAFFAGCYGKGYSCDPPDYLSGAQPCCICNFDGSADSFVGPGDFAGFAGCYGRTCDACDTCWGYRAGRDRENSEQAATLVSVALVAAKGPTPVSMAEELPRSQRQLAVEKTFYVEVWARIDGASDGLAAVYVDVMFDPTRLTVQELVPDPLFGTFAGGAWNPQNGRIRSAGGCALLGEDSLGLGSWVRVTTVKMHVRRDGATPIQTGPAATGYGVAVLNHLGTLDGSQVVFGEITVDLRDRASEVGRLEDREADGEQTIQDRP